MLIPKNRVVLPLLLTLFVCSRVSHGSEEATGDFQATTGETPSANYGTAAKKLGIRQRNLRERNGKMMGAKMDDDKDKSRGKMTKQSMPGRSSGGKMSCGDGGKMRGGGKMMAKPDSKMTGIGDCDGKKEDNGPLVKAAASNARTYDVLVLDGIDETKVDWNVTAFSRVTSFSFMAPERLAPSLEAELEDPTTVPYASLPADPGIENYGTALHIADLSDVEEMQVAIPKEVKRLCINGVCRPVLCPLAHVADPTDPTTGFSFAPSNEHVYFGGSIDCSIVKPEFWDDFVQTFYPTYPGSPEDLYMDDPDGDGVSNIIEYYGAAAPSIFSSSQGPTGRVLSNSGAWTNPFSIDTDGDLLTDAFEIRFGLDPLVFDDISQDVDGDGLDYLKEQIFLTDPTSSDTDKDGFNDNTEIDQGSDPRNDKSRDANEEKVDVTLTIGDHSGSHSERYTMFIGSIEHQSPDFGELGTVTYPFTKGTYTIIVRWVASRLSTPDYDYRATIVPAASDDLDVTIDDPQGILGTHSESSYDFAAGKSATMTISGKCDVPQEEGEPKDCSCFESCIDCNTESHCEWSKEGKTCGDYEGIFTMYKDGPEDCACQKCEEWATKELRNLSWIDTLPQCPCAVTFSFWSVVVARTAAVDPSVWSTDLACGPAFGFCDYYHPGAHACIRARASSSDAGQQCCYDNSGNIISAGAGAGTPDKVSSEVSISRHQTADVDPFEDCCKHCDDKDRYCPYYIGGAGRTGARQERRGCVP